MIEANVVVLSIAMPDDRNRDGIPRNDKEHADHGLAGEEHSEWGQLVPVPVVLWGVVPVLSIWDLHHVDGEMEPRDHGRCDASEAIQPHFSAFR